jgi:nitrogen fixation protein FixH
MQRELTGRHVLAITVSAFTIIIAVNLTMAWKAVSTFPGLEVKNSYVASQSFDADRTAQQALGWTVTTRVVDGVLRVSVAGPDGHPADVAAVEGLIGRTTSRGEDQTPAFERVAEATFEAPVAVSRGQWVLQLRATSGDGTAFRQRVAIAVDS